MHSSTRSNCGTVALQRCQDRFKNGVGTASSPNDCRENGLYGDETVPPPARLRKAGRSLVRILSASLVVVIGLAGARADDATANIVGWVTNGVAVFMRVLVPATNATGAAQTAATPKPENTSGVPEQPAYFTNRVFHHFRPDSLNHLVWTNVMARTNGRDTTVWSVRTHSALWPATPPVAVWNTNSLIWGLKGFTAISPCWEVEGAPGQVAVTALTRRHGYARGHGMGADGFNTGFAGKKVWFLTANNKIVEAKVVRNVVRTMKGGANRDYTILLFSHDLPTSIEPMRAVADVDISWKYRPCFGAPLPYFKTEQTGHVSAEIPGFTLNTWKGGDSGSPDMLPLPGELGFCSGRSTSGPSKQMQVDMDELCMEEGLNPKHYQLQWVDLSKFPQYQ